MQDPVCKCWPAIVKMPQCRRDQAKFARFLLIIVFVESLFVLAMMHWEHLHAQSIYHSKIAEVKGKLWREAQEKDQLNSDQDKHHHQETFLDSEDSNENYHPGFFKSRHVDSQLHSRFAERLSLQSVDHKEYSLEMEHSKSFKSKTNKNKAKSWDIYDYNHILEENNLNLNSLPKIVPKVGEQKYNNVEGQRSNSILLNILSFRDHDDIALKSQFRDERRKIRGSIL